VNAYEVKADVVNSTAEIS